MILIDTHILLWIIFSPDKIPEKTLKQLRKAENSAGAIKISSVSFWEIAVKELKKKLTLPVSVSELYERCSSIEPFEIINPNALEWISAAQLKWKNRDPVDRLLVHTSKSRELSLATVDQEIRKFHKDCV